ncbi:hypothetical protein FRC08_008628 [Ceratobasidium sp. 394]|nr:hypothetical protein FRC08_008628 [Ceratobasidium sp. 394]
MFIPLFPLLTVATALQEITFTYLNYDRAANFIVWAAWGMVAGSATELVMGPVTHMRLQMEGQISGPLMVHVRVQLEAVPTPFSYFNPTSSSYQPAVNSPYLNLSSGGFEPTRPWSALSPIHGYANRLSMSLSPLPLFPCTLSAVPTSLGINDTSGDMGISRNPLAAEDGLTILRSTMAPLSVAPNDSDEEFPPLPPTDIDGELIVASPLAIIVFQPSVPESAAEESTSIPPSSLASPGRDDDTVATLDSAVATPTPALLISATAHPSLDAATGSPSCASHYAWFLVCASLAVLAFALGRYLAPYKRAEVPPTLQNQRSQEELGDLPYIMKQHDITPTELQKCIERLARDRQAAHGNPTTETEGPSDQGRPVLIQFIRVESVASRVSSAGSPPVPPPSNARQEEHVSTTGATAKRSVASQTSSAGSRPVPGPSNARQEKRVSTTSATSNRSPGTSNQFNRLKAKIEELSAIIDRADSVTEEKWALRARLGLVPKQLQRPDRAPQLDQSLESNAPVARSSVEPWKTEARARANVSPLAQKGARHLSGLPLGGVMSAPKRSDTRTRPEVSRAGCSAAVDVEGAGSVTLDPIATSSPVRAHQDGSSAMNRARRSTRITDPMSPDVFFPSQDGPSLLRESLPPRSPAYVTFGTLADAYPPRPQAPEPDRTISSGTLSPSPAGSSLLREPLPPRSPAYISFGTLADAYPPRPQAPEPDRTLDSESSTEFSGGGPIHNIFGEELNG